MTAVDVWTIICRIFLFGSLIEFTIAYYYFEGKEKSGHEENLEYAKDITEMGPKVTSDLMPVIIVFALNHSINVFLNYLGYQRSSLGYCH